MVLAFIILFFRHLKFQWFGLLLKNKGQHGGVRNQLSVGSWHRSHVGYTHKAASFKALDS